MKTALGLFEIATVNSGKNKIVKKTFIAVIPSEEIGKEIINAHKSLSNRDLIVEPIASYESADDHTSVKQLKEKIEQENELNKVAMRLAEMNDQQLQTLNLKPEIISRVNNIRNQMKVNA